MIILLLPFNQIKQVFLIKSKNTTIQLVKKVILYASCLTKHLFLNRLVQQIIYSIVHFKVFVAFLETLMMKPYRKINVLFQIKCTLIHYNSLGFLLCTLIHYSSLGFLLLGKFHKLTEAKLINSINSKRWRK